MRDGWVAYRGYTAAAHQSCLAHWCRRLSELCESLPEAHRWVPANAEVVLQTALEIRDLRAAGRFDKDKVAVALVELDRCVDKLIGLPAAHEDNRRMLAHLRTERRALFMSCATPRWTPRTGGPSMGSEARSFNRNTWGGNRTDVGASTLEAVSSVLRTANQESLDVIAVFGDLLRSPVPMVAPFVGLNARPPPPC